MPVPLHSFETESRRRFGEYVARLRASRGMTRNSLTIELTLVAYLVKDGVLWDNLEKVTVDWLRKVELGKAPVPYWAIQPLAQAMALSPAEREGLLDCLTPDLSDLVEAQTVRPVLPHYANPLSPREREIVRLAADGLVSRQIADRLFITKETVDTHMNNVRQKLGVKKRKQAIAIAVDQGMV